jgi:hypothetical protein
MAQTAANPLRVHQAGNHTPAAWPHFEAAADGSRAGRTTFLPVDHAQLVATEAVWRRTRDSFY